MHLVICTQYYPPEVGAPQNRLSELARLFVLSGHSVTVLTAMPNYPSGRIHKGYGGWWRRESIDGVNVLRTLIYPTQSTGFLKRLASYFSFVFSSAFCGSFLLQRADFLLVESPPLFLGLSGWWLSRLKRARLIFNVSDLWPESAVELGFIRRDGALHKLSSRLESFCYKRAWLVTGQSKSIIANIQKRFPRSQTYHLSNGVDVKRFAQRDGFQARAALQLNGDCVALYAGLHGVAQGLSQVLEAAESLSGEPHLKFVLVGDGPEKQMLIAAAHARGLENIEFLSPRPATEMPALIAAADIVLVPLKSFISGAVPSKLYEAMASGKPVVLVAEGEGAEIVQEHRAGVTVKPGDINGLAAAVKRLANDAPSRRTFGENGKRAAEQHFDRDNLVDRFRELLETRLALDAPSPPSRERS
jgi:glycosyltransferase involved in cell wall biosynthesis